MINYIELNDKISNWLKDYLDNSGLETYVIGVSGGIDSALVSTLCAMTGKPVHVFNIPIKYSAGMFFELEYLRTSFATLLACCIFIPL